MISPVRRELQVEYAAGVARVAVGHLVLPPGDRVYGRVQLAVQAALVAVLGPEAVLAVPQVRVAKVDGPPALDALQTVRVVVRRAHDGGPPRVHSAVVVTAGGAESTVPGDDEDGCGLG